MITGSLKKTLRQGSRSFALELELTVAHTHCTALYGPSGAGKTSLLRMICGLLKPDSGFLEVAGECWYDSRTRAWLPPGQRRVGYMAQDGQLYPHMTLWENLRYAQPPKASPDTLQPLLEQAGLAELATLKPAALSGGQHRRALLLRSLVQEPRLLLLDEPFVGLDPESKQQLQALVRQVQQEREMTLIFVSHNLGEVLLLADQVLCIQEGRLVDSGSPLELFGPGETSATSQLQGTILGQRPTQGAKILLDILVSDQWFTLEVAPETASTYATGSSVALNFEGEQLKLRPLN